MAACSFKIEKFLKGCNNIKLGKPLKAMLLQRAAISTNIHTCHSSKTCKRSYIACGLDNTGKKNNCSKDSINLIQRRLFSNGDTSDEFTRDDSELTHFGYEQVREVEKVDKVYDVFEKVAESYDLMNDVMSAGIHRLWKQRFVQQLNVKPGMTILDMAGGTGDIAFKILDDLASKSTPMSSNVNDTKIIISDINQSMLDVGKKRAEKLGIQQSFEWVQANAEELPFEDESIDLYTIAFGIRNATHIEQVLDEALRVLKVGGRISCLEFSTVENPLLRELYDGYSFEVIPVLGAVVAQDWDSYKYLVESIRQFPRQEEFAEMLYEAGFSSVRYENMTFGVVAAHDGFKI